MKKHVALDTPYEQPVFSPSIWTPTPEAGGATVDTIGPFPSLEVSRAALADEPEMRVYMTDYFNRAVALHQMMVPACKVAIAGIAYGLPSVSFDAPCPPGAHPENDGVEEKMIQFCEQFGLYQESDVIKAGLKRSGLSYLFGTVAPFFPVKELLLSVNYLAALFNNDDKLDEVSPSPEPEQPSTEEEKPTESLHRHNTWGLTSLSSLALLGALSGDKVSKNAPSRVKAMAALYKDLKEYDIVDAESAPAFYETLGRYLQSCQVEQIDAASHSRRAVDEQSYLLNREKTGGLPNVLAFQLKLIGIEMDRLSKEYPEFNDMVVALAGAVGALNDLISLPKELKEVEVQAKAILHRKYLEKKASLEEKAKSFTEFPQKFKDELEQLADRADHPTEEDIKRVVSRNLVLIKWKRGVPLGQAIDETRQKYQEYIESYYRRRASFLAGASHNQDWGAKLALLIMDGWLSGHPVWALLSGRYHKIGRLSILAINEFCKELRNTQTTQIKSVPEVLRMFSRVVGT